MHSNEESVTIYLLLIFVPLALSLVFTRVLITLCRRRRLLAAPVADRWHRTPTPAIGGVAIYLAIVFSLVALNLRLPHGGAWLVAMSTAAFALGLIDDLRKLRPHWKFLGQFACAVAFLAFAPEFRITGIEPLDTIIILFWLVGITNAFNLLDNMNGLCTGAAAISALALVVASIPLGHERIAFFCLPWLGTLLGFLCFNFPSGRIFMGDSGSQFLGFSLAAASLLSFAPASAVRPSLWAIPVLLFLLPIADTSFVTLSRLRAGRSVVCGGLDHISHRLVRLGLSEQWAVSLLWVFAGLSSTVAILGLTLGFRPLLPFVAIFLGALISILTFLLHSEHSSISTSASSPIVSPPTLPSQPETVRPPLLVRGG